MRLESASEEVRLRGTKRPMRGRRLASGLMASLLAGCSLVGPDFATPDAKLNPAWLQSGKSRIVAAPDENALWWRTFDDPALTADRARLRAESALQSAGARVLQARAQLAAAIGEEYPQQQQAVGSLLRERESARGAGRADRRRLGCWNTPSNTVGVQAAWEIDLWGKFRRSVESADAQLAASVANYDDVLVSLTADLATAYLQLRTLQQQLAVALVQRQGAGGGAADRDRALSRRHDRRARRRAGEDHPGLDQGDDPAARAADRADPKNAIATLIGRAAGTARRSARPDPRASRCAPSQVGDRHSGRVCCGAGRTSAQAEAAAAAQSALIGVQKADLYPAFSLTGTFGFAASSWSGRSTCPTSSRAAAAPSAFGPSFVWDFLNYGRIENAVRAQDAAFQAGATSYQNTVLLAQQEVENGLIGFRKQQERAKFLSEAVRAARALASTSPCCSTSNGVTDFTTVLTAEQQLLQQQDALAVTAGAIPTNLVAAYRALGGGWQIREGKSFLPPQTVEAMAQRTNWGRLLAYEVKVPPMPVPRPDRIPAARTMSVPLHAPDHADRRRRPARCCAGCEDEQRNAYVAPPPPPVTVAAPQRADGDRLYRADRHHRGDRHGPAGGAGRGLPRADPFPGRRSG